MEERLTARVTRRAFLRDLLVAGSALAMPHVSKAQARQMSLIHISADDLSLADWGSANWPVRYPYLEQRFQREGTLLNNVQTCAPVCSPSRAGLLMGLNPAREGIFGTVGAGVNRRDWIPVDYGTVAKAFRAAGRTTGCVGKWHKGKDPRAISCRNYGFDFMEGYGFPNSEPGAFRGCVGTWFINLANMTDTLAAKRQIDHVVRDRSIAFISQFLAEGPIFLDVAFHSPHRPINPAPEYMNAVRNLADEWGRPTPAQYYCAAIYQWQTCIERIFRAVIAAGAADRTIILVDADNAGATSSIADYSSDQWGRNGPFRGTKHGVGNGGLRVRGGAWGPGVAAGHVAQSSICNTDYAATFAALCDVNYTYRTDGEDRSSVILGRDTRRTKPIFSVQAVDLTAATVNQIEKFPTFRGDFLYGDKSYTVFLDFDHDTDTASNVQVYLANDLAQIRDLNHPDVKRAQFAASGISATTNFARNLRGWQRWNVATDNVFAD